jgi:hypothetical protein
MTDAIPAPTPDQEAARWQEARQLRSQHDAWVIIWHTHRDEFRAYPLFKARPGLVLAAPTPGELAASMDQAEQVHRRPRATPRHQDPTE